MTSRESWRLAYRDRFRNLFNQDFQSWFETLLRALHTSGDFQAIRKTSGDGGLDGFVINSQVVYQAYAPARMNDMRDGETAAKIRNDFAKAQRTLAGRLKEWTFVHNHSEGKIGQLSAGALSEIKQNHPDIAVQVLDVDSLWTRLENLPESLLSKLLGQGDDTRREGVRTRQRSHSGPGKDNGSGEPKRNVRPRYIFLQFLNPEIRALYQTDGGLTERQLHLEWIRILKYAFLVADKGLAIPASYMFEVPEMTALLEDLHVVRKQGLVHLVSSTRDLVLYAGQKRREYRDELWLFPHYAGEDDARPENSQLIWLPRVARSASGDIGAAWRGELEQAGGLWPELLRGAQSLQFTLPSLLESTISAVPDRLDGRAFIFRFAKQLLPFTLDTAGETRLKLLISREYLRSYLLEIDAAVLVETPIGNLDCGIEKYNADGRLQTVSWRAVADCFETLRIRAHLEALSWRDLWRLRVQPILHWLMELILTPSREDRSIFEEVVTLSGFRAPEPQIRSRRRPYDVVTDQIWRFQSAASPVLYAYNWSDIAIAGASRPSLLPKRRGRRATQPLQLTMLPDACDVGIIVALPEEFRELQRQLADRWKPLYDEETATDYYLFTRDGPEGITSYSCVTTFAGSMGPAKAALLTEKLRRRWRVRVLVNVGIAGALDDDVRLGAVVAGSVADNYLERAKAVDAPGADGFEFELAGEPFRSSRALVDACAHLEFAYPILFAQWRENCQSLLSSLPAEQLAPLRAAKLLAEPSVFIHGHVACGPTVGASVAFKRWLKKRDRSYLTLDMESGGVLLAVYEAARATEGLVLRGVSDFADERKAELDRIGRGDLRRYAMHNALQFLWSLMRTGRLPRAEFE